MFALLCQGTKLTLGNSNKQMILKVWRQARLQGSATGMSGCV